MSKKSANKRQHYVPACYLKAWLDPSAPRMPTVMPYVWTFEKDGTNPKNKPPEKIFREADMYTVRLPDGGRDLQLEHRLAEVEGNFTKVRTSKLNFRRELTGPDWLWVCLFVALARTRTVESRDHFLGQMEKVRDMFTQVVGEDRETLTTPPELPPDVDKSRIYVPQPGDFDNLKESTIQTLLSSAAEVLMPALLSMHATVMCTDDSLGFLTSDAPVTWFDPTAHTRHPLMRPYGLTAPYIEITMPLSPSQCIVFTHHEVGPPYMDVPVEWVEAFNHRHRAFAPTKIITKRNELRAKWFEDSPPPPDSWEALNPEEASTWEFPD
jgi:hypothetical protein